MHDNGRHCRKLSCASYTVQALQGGQLVCTDKVFAFRPAWHWSSKTQSEARKDAASGTTQPKEPADDRDFAKKTADCKLYEEQLEVY